MKKEELSALMSEMHNDIEALDAMHIRLRKNGASSDILVMLERAREQIKADRDKHLEEFKKGGHE